MTHEKEKAQYEEDRKNHERPWELWEYRKKSGIYFTDWSPLPGYPEWNSEFEYRRKESVFEPEYFTGLNWRDARPLVKMRVECSMDGDRWVGPFTLKTVCDIPEYLCKFKCGQCNYPYIRTCPQPVKHPTITIGGVELPRPETDALEEGIVYWAFDPSEENLLYNTTWRNHMMDEYYLKNKCIHLTESRAQAWADWWVDTVIKAIKG